MYLAEIQNRVSQSEWEEGLTRARMEGIKKIVAALFVSCS